MTDCYRSGIGDCDGDGFVGMYLATCLRLKLVWKKKMKKKTTMTMKRNKHWPSLPNDIPQRQQVSLDTNREH